MAKKRYIRRYGQEGGKDLTVEVMYTKEKTTLVFSSGGKDEFMLHTTNANDMFRLLLELELMVNEMMDDKKIPLPKWSMMEHRTEQSDLPLQ